MRYLFVIAFSISVAVLSAQTKKITLKTDDKNSQHGFSFWTDVKVSSTDTSFYYLLHAQKKDVIELVKPGEYTLTFNSVFGDKIRRTIRVGKKNRYTLKIKGLKAMYGEVPSSITFMDKLKSGDTVYIISSSLENISYEKIAVTRLADGRYKAIQYQGLTDDVFQEFTTNENTYLRAAAFEKLVKELPAGTCIPSIITFFYKKQYYSLLDRSCPDNTIHRIKSLMFLIEGK